MLRHMSILILCISSGILTINCSCAENVTIDRSSKISESEGRWKDPPSGKGLPDESSGQSRDQPSELKTRLKRLEERIAIISQDLKAGRRIDGLEIRAKAVLREADKIKAQARLEQEAALKLAAKVEALKEQITAIARDHSQPIVPQGIAIATKRRVPSTTEAQSKLAAEAKRLPPQTKTTKAPVREVGNLSIKKSQTKIKDKQIMKTAKLYRAGIHHPFALPNTLRPIGF